MKSVLLYVSISLALIISALYFYIKSIVDSFNVSFGLDDLNLKDLNFKSIGLGNSYVKVKLKFIISFFGLSSIKFSDLKLKIYYNGVLVANSTDNADNNKQVIIYESIKNVVYHSFDIQVNKSSIELAYNIKSNANYIIDYELSLKLFGFSVNYKGKYKNN